MQLIPKSDRIEVKHVQRFIDRAQAKDDHLTASQVTEFLRNPDGPRLPELCLEARRLPDTFRNVPHERPILDLAVVSLANVTRPWVVTIIARTCVAAHMSCGQVQYLAVDEFPFGVSCTASIIGFRSGAPVIAVQRLVDDGEDGWVFGESFVRTFATGARVPCGAAATLLRDGSVISLLRELREGNQFSVLRDGERIRSTRLEYRRFFELPNGTIAGEAFPQRGCANKFVLINDESMVLHQQGEIAVSGHEIFRIDTEGAVACAPMRGTVEGTFEHGRGSSAPESSQWRAIGQNDYLGRYTRFADDRDAYVGRATHGDGDCWVIDGAAQPGFDHVSALFEDFEEDGRWCYWASSGRYLYKMAVPPATQSAE